AVLETGRHVGKRQGPNCTDLKPLSMSQEPRAHKSSKIARNTAGHETGRHEHMRQCQDSADCQPLRMSQEPVVPSSARLAHNTAALKIGRRESRRQHPGCSNSEPANPAILPAAHIPAPAYAVALRWNSRFVDSSIVPIRSIAESALRYLLN